MRQEERFVLQEFFLLSQKFLSIERSQSLSHRIELEYKYLLRENQSAEGKEVNILHTEVPNLSLKNCITRMFRKWEKNVPIDSIFCNEEYSSADFSFLCS